MYSEGVEKGVGGDCRIREECQRSVQGVSKVGKSGV